MKILIAYATKTGTTEKCARMLAGNLPSHEVTLANLSESVPATDGYDLVVVGSPVRFGKLHKKVTEYLTVNREKLKAVRAGYFITCGFVDSGEEYIAKLIPDDLLGCASAVECFGGELILKKQHGFDRVLTRLMINYILDEGKHDGEAKERSLPDIMPDSISRFADAVKKAR